jgi:aryl-alcohol dehydrogenase-like predicted oxidoreductase
VVPIAGTRRLNYLKDNLAATQIVLSRQDLELLEEDVPKGVAHGARFGDMSFVNR